MEKVQRLKEFGCTYFIATQVRYVETPRRTESFWYARESHAVIFFSPSIRTLFVGEVLLFDQTTTDSLGLPIPLLVVDSIQSATNQP